MKRTVGDIIKSKSLAAVEFVQDTTSFLDAAKKIYKNQNESLIVLNINEIFGIVTEKDIFNTLNKYDFQMDKLKDLQIKNITSRNMIFVDASYTLEECLFIMCNQKIHHLPIFEDGENTPAYILSLKNISDILMKDKIFHINELEKYITGRNQSSEDKFKIREHKILKAPALTRTQ